MTDAPPGLLLQEVIQTVLLRIAVVRHGLFIDIVQQVEIEVIDAAALQLFFEHLRRLQFLHTVDILVSGELIRQIPGLSGIPGQGPAERPFGFPVVVRMGSVEVVDSGCHRCVHHPVQLRLVNAAGSVRTQRQAHRAETESRELKVLKLFVYHVRHP